MVVGETCKTFALRYAHAIVRHANTHPASVLTSFSGLLHIVLVVLGRVSFFADLDQYTPYLEDWAERKQSSSHLMEYPSDATRYVTPIPCHSHNDYWRKVPLFSAISWGCTGVGADVWLHDGDEELYIGHMTAALTSERTFAKLNIELLVKLLDSM